MNAGEKGTSGLCRVKLIDRGQNKVNCTAPLVGTEAMLSEAGDGSLGIAFNSG